MDAPTLGLSDNHEHEFAQQIKYLHQNYKNASEGYIELAAATNLLQILAWRVQQTLRDGGAMDETGEMRTAIEHKIRAAHPDADVATVLYQSLPFHEMDELSKEAEKLCSTHKDEGNEAPLPIGASNIEKARKTFKSSYAEAIQNNDTRLTKIAAALETYAQQFEDFAEKYGGDMYGYNRDQLKDGATLARHYSDIARNLEPESPDTWKRG